MARRPGGIVVEVAFYPEDGPIHDKILELTGSKRSRARLVHRYCTVMAEIEARGLSFLPDRESAIPEMTGTDLPSVDNGGDEDGFAP